MNQIQKQLVIFVECNGVLFFRLAHNCGVYAVYFMAYYTVLGAVFSYIFLLKKT